MAVYLARIKSCRKKGTSMRTFTLDIPEGMHWTAGAHMKVALWEGLSPELAQRLKSADSNEGRWGTTALKAGDFAPPFTRTFSISTRECDGVIVFSTRISENASLFKATLGTYKEGDSIFILSWGTDLQVPPNGPMVALTMGVGMSGMHAVIRDMLEGGAEGPLISLNVAEPLEELMELEVHDSRVTYMYKNNRYSFEQQVKRLLADDTLVRTARFVVIGGHRFMVEWIGVLLSNGVTAAQIYIDRPDEQRSLYIKEPVADYRK